ncbi:hemicentin-2-like [Tubulanus polymorphus]|uniref:hemicentin-2-like n=1 Tax=Tubulanus polymorphus TaxID=672921 RepID=UPI003DA1DDEF
MIMFVHVGILCFVGFSVIAARTITVEEGKPFEIPCRFPGKSPGRSLMWMFRDQAGTEPIHIANGCRQIREFDSKSIGLRYATCRRRSGFYKLTFTNALLESEGVYSCVAGNQKIDTTVQVTEANSNYNVTTLIDPFTPTPVIEGQTFRIVCNVPGRPTGKTVQWYFDAGPGRRGKIAHNCRVTRSSLAWSLGIRYANCDRSTLSLEMMATPKNTGNYTCIIGEQRSTVSLTVKDTDFAVAAGLMPGNEVVKGSRASFYCTTRGLPASKSVRWYFKSRTRSGYINSGCNLNGLTEYLGIEAITCRGDAISIRLDIPRVRAENTGSYICIVGNKRRTLHFSVTGAN